MRRRLGAGILIAFIVASTAGTSAAQASAPVTLSDPVPAVVCAPCQGQGGTYCLACSGGGREICPACDGTGVLQLGMGPVACGCTGGLTGRPCLACQGRTMTPCSVCGGAGAFGGPEPRRWIDLAGYRFLGPYTTPHALAAYPGVMALAYLGDDDLWYILNVATSATGGVGALFTEDEAIRTTLADPAASGLVLGAAVFYAKDAALQETVAKEIVGQYLTESGP